ncbi:glycoside hydrolase family 43 protein [Micromonospora echinofusca]|uniref:Family 43 glycosylhydrolase n=1 Tax=Micromonospora echinofusca TaxID=47858 RepID=A0ABS3VLW1_MICEH|nr:glycoside hydrolase family 43 protein [Micromonospora echinofusca]MBO4205468.1 family 43 glycosylhydrolase [Micromonospora echinofusca]
MTFTNPVHHTDTPDPQAIRVGDTWYLFHTNADGRNVPVLTSPDLVTWTPFGDALPELPGWADPGRTWAPEVIALADDRYLLYYTVAGRESGRQCVGRAVATTPGGPYRDDSTGPLICQADLGGAIDASPFRDTDGSLWLLWKNDGNAIGVDTWIWSQRLSPDGLSLVGTPHRLLKQTEAWEGHLVEGPFLWRQDGTLLLFYAANAYDRAEYAEGYAVCESPAGPCVKAPENPVLRSNAAASGPGHASMVAHGGRTWLLYHAWPPGREGAAEPGRQLWLDEVTWADGRPRVHGPTGTAQPHP